MRFQEYFLFFISRHFKQDTYTNSIRVQGNALDSCAITKLYDTDSWPSPLSAILKQKRNSWTYFSQDRGSVSYRIMTCRGLRQTIFCSLCAKNFKIKIWLTENIGQYYPRRTFELEFSQLFRHMPFKISLKESILES